jgi:hypothetical protein
MRLGLLVNAAAGIFVVGFIWTMQLIHYPLFDYVGEEAFPAYKITHNRLFLLMAGPGILVTLATSVLLIFARPQQIPLWAVLLRLAFFAVIVVSTAFFQAPQHQVLSGHFDPDAYAFLLNTNRIRAAVWSAYGILDLWMTWQAARAVSFA